jgi:NAD(P)-dependent dehydrogenase (short-subunit alcohol dehydrogenase family)
MSSTDILSGKIALITGAQQGIGRATAIACARAGADVVVNYLDDPEAAAAVAQSIRDTGRRTATVQGDVRRSDDIERMLAAADELGGIDILVNNAGIFPRVEFLKMSEADWDEVHDVNL